MKILKKYFLVEKDDHIYCSKCGKFILKDTYQYKKHQEQCKVKFENLYNPIKEEELFAYCFDQKDNSIMFYVLNINLSEKTINSNTYKNIKWNIVFKSKFSNDSKIIKEKGLYNIDIWCKKLMNSDNMFCLSAQNDIDLFFKNTFKSIPFLYNYGMFIDIYRQRGYKYNNINVDKIKLLNKTILNKNDLKKIFSRYNTKRYIDVIEHKVDEDIVLELNLYYSINEDPINIFISQDFVFNENNNDLRIFLEENCVYNLNNINNFKTKYSDLMIDNYINSGGSNLFRIVMSPNYNKLEENLGKAELGYLADNVCKKEIYVKNVYGNNIKEIFGYKKNIIKHFNHCFNSEFLNEEFLNAFNNLCEFQPAIANLDLSYACFKFIDTNFVGQKYNRIKNIKVINEKEMLKIFNMIIKDPHILIYYSDYMNICNELDSYPYGKVPQNIYLAHDYVSEIYMLNKDKITTQNFKKAIESDDYRILDSNAYLTENNKINYKKKESIYKVILPKTPNDLNKESEYLNHCVRTYIKKVAQRETYILFLRKTDEINKPFATIEVVRNEKTNQLELIQLKAYNNKKAPNDAQLFVKEWAIEKNIKISTLDMYV